MTIISKPPTESVNGRQMRAALVIAHLAQLELPPVYRWAIEPPSLKERTGIHVDALLDVGPRSRIEEWARFLGGEVQEAPFQDKPKTKLWTEATYQGVHVKLWTTIPADGEKAEVA